MITTETMRVPVKENSSKIDPMETRWGINCTVRDKYVDSTKTGFNFLPFAKWFPVTRHQTMEEFHTTDDNPSLPRENLVTKSALSVERYLDEMLGGKAVDGNTDPNQTDWGIRFSFYGNNDVAMMAAISASILPSLSTIREFADTAGIPSPIAAVCDGQDATDFSDRDSCPSCWVSWIESAASDAYLEHIAERGQMVAVTDTQSGAVTERNVFVPMDELLAARAIAVESLKHGLVAGKKIWADIASELTKGQRQDIDSYQENLRKDLHQTRPADAQMAQVREYAKAVNGNGSNNDVLMMLAKSQIATNELLGKIVEQGGIKPYQASTAGDGYIVGDNVTIDGGQGTIVETKAGGWFVVDTPSGTQTVRKDKFSKGE